MRKVASSPPETHYFQATDYATVSSVLSDLIDLSCSVAIQGDQTLNTTTTNTETTAKAMTTTSPPPSTTTCECVTPTPTSTTTTPLGNGGEGDNSTEGKILHIYSRNL